MEKLISDLKSKYGVKDVERCEDGTVELDCGRLAPRLDHYMCGSEYCSCYEAEG
jgi:hypothetical protein